MKFAQLYYYGAQWDTIPLCPILVVPLCPMFTFSSQCYIWQHSWKHMAIQAFRGKHIQELYLHYVQIIKLFSTQGLETYTNLQQKNCSYLFKINEVQHRRPQAAQPPPLTVVEALPGEGYRTGRTTSRVARYLKNHDCPTVPHVPLCPTFPTY